VARVRALGDVDHLGDEENGVVHQIPAGLQDQGRTRIGREGGLELVHDGGHVLVDGPRVPALGLAVARLQAVGREAASEVDAAQPAGVIRNRLLGEGGQRAGRQAIAVGIGRVAEAVEVERPKLQGRAVANPPHGGIGLTGVDREPETAVPEVGQRGAHADSDFVRTAESAGDADQAIQLGRAMHVEQGTVDERTAQLVLALVGPVEDDLFAGIAELPGHGVLASRHDLGANAQLLRQLQPGHLVVRLERVRDCGRSPVAAQQVPHHDGAIC
jgi:hypothetical protein